MPCAAATATDERSSMHAWKWVVSHRRLQCKCRTLLYPCVKLIQWRGSIFFLVTMEPKRSSSNPSSRRHWRRQSYSPVSEHPNRQQHGQPLATTGIPLQGLELWWDYSLRLWVPVFSDHDCLWVLVFSLYVWKNSAKDPTTCECSRSEFFLI
jgi:hypothetical protein